MVENASKTTDDLALAIEKLEQVKNFDTAFAVCSAQRIAFHDLYGQYLLDKSTDLTRLDALMNTALKVFSGLENMQVPNELGNLPVREIADSMRFRCTLLSILVLKGNHEMQRMLDSHMRERAHRESSRSFS